VVDNFTKCGSSVNLCAPITRRLTIVWINVALMLNWCTGNRHVYGYRFFRTGTKSAFHVLSGTQLSVVCLSWAVAVYCFRIYSLYRPILMASCVRLSLLEPVVMQVLYVPASCNTRMVFCYLLHWVIFRNYCSSMNMIWVNYISQSTLKILFALELVSG
jgi:hypothetical protein